MISIDTNVLLRYLLADDESQYKQAKRLILKQRPVLITDVVLMETIWTLAGKRYRYQKQALCEIVRGLIGDGAFIFESNQVVWSALNDYKESTTVAGKALDFADALIVHKAHYSAAEKAQSLAGCYSFDQAVKQLPGAKLLAGD